jgi:phosphate-selective porin OprO/OprP
VFIKTRIITFSTVFLLSVMSVAPAPAYAVNETMANLLSILRDRGSISQDEYNALMHAAKSEEDSAEKLEKMVEEKTKDLPKINTKGKLEIESADGQHSFQPIGRIFWDSIWIDDDGTNSVSGGSELRRARLGFEAQFFKYWKAKLEYDFAGGEAALKDGYISYNNKFGGGSKYSVKVGQHHVPFGFATKNSSKYMSFLRRPLFADGPLSPARQYGAAMEIHEPDYRWDVNFGWFLGEPDDGKVNVEGAGEDAQTWAVRVTGIPFMTDHKHMLHVGGSYMHLDTEGDGLRVRQRALTHMDPTRMFDTGTWAGDQDVDAFDGEVLGIYGPFYALGEFVWWNVDDPTADADLSAWSMEAGWFLTGESKHYSKTFWSSISPNREFGKGGWGAWEVAIRYENMDLNDGMIVGGDGDVFTAGLNWYPIKNVRFMADYSKVVDFSRPGNADDGREPSAVSIRSMVYW